MMCRLIKIAPTSALALWALPAQAHVKWFSPYIVGAEPQSPMMTLGDPWFWAGIGLVLVFLIATRLIEETPLGQTANGVIDWITGPIWHRLDEFTRAVMAAFFVAIFAVGGVYLTPDLKTPAEWVSWMQLGIAACIFFRPLMPIAAAGIIGLWLLALRDYDLFHLFDYLALGLGVAAYLALAGQRNEGLRAHRFEVLRWAVAISLMWSSLEKFAYPEWFYPLITEKPFLTFGMPRDMFIPMAGVAEFTLGFGLLATPLMRRLSAIALLLLFNLAVFPFGRVDMIGHALIMVMLVVIASDRTRELHFLQGIRQNTALMPLSLAGFLLAFGMAYWGLHAVFYGMEGQENLPAVLDTHSPDPDHPHDQPMLH